MEVSNITRLIHAVQTEDITTIRKLSLLCGSDVNTPDGNGRIALHVAAKYGRTKSVRILLENPKINVNKAADDGWTPLTSAAYTVNVGIIRLLLNHPKIDVNKADYFGWTPLNRVAEAG
eukprot:527297_1